jgi:hypothetical protein
LRWGGFRRRIEIRRLTPPLPAQRAARFDMLIAGKCGR